MGPQFPRGSAEPGPGRSTRGAHARALVAADLARLRQAAARLREAGLRRGLSGAARRSRAALDRWRHRAGPDSSRIARLTAAAVFAYLAVGQVFPGSNDITGPLTALLVVQASLVETLAQGVGRIAAVLTGVLIATILASVAGLTWWSLGIAVSFALALAYIMNLGDHVLETPISAMLILGVSSPETAATVRVAMTLIGAGVGIVFTLLLPPPVLAAGAPDSVRAVSARTAAALRRTARELPGGGGPGRFDAWIRGVHRTMPLVAAADAELTESEHRRRFNPRAIGHDGAIPVLRAGLASLDRIILAIRSALMSLQACFPGESEMSARDRELAGAFAVVFDGLADAVDSYGEFVLFEAAGEHERALAQLSVTAEAAGETRAFLDEFTMSAPDASGWLLHPAVVAGVEQVLFELSPQRQRERLADWRARQAAAGAFRAPQALDRAWLRRRGGAGGPARPEAPIGPPTLAISYREVRDARELEPGDFRPAREPRPPGADEDPAAGAE